MSVVQVSQSRSRGDYEKVIGVLDLTSDTPAGLICHAAAETPSGEVLIIDLWASKEALQEFVDRRLFPAFRAAGLQGLTAGEQPRPHATFDLVLGERS